MDQVFSQVSGLIAAGRISGIQQIEIDPFEDAIQMVIRFNGKFSSSTAAPVTVVEFFADDYSAMQYTTGVFQLLADAGLASRSDVALWRRNLMVAVG